METQQALADLLASSPQVEAATVFGYHDERLGSVGISGSVTAAVRAGRALLEGGRDVRGEGEATQVHASLAGGDVFVVTKRRGGPAILAVTAERQPPGLLFHDLKRCLAAIAGEEE